MTIRPDLFDDEVWDELDDEPIRCEVCDAELDYNDRNPCDDCTGLRHCVDDICHGLGYCMHDPDAWQP